MNNYIVKLVNNQGCTFDTGCFTSIKSAKKWAKRNGSYIAYITVTLGETIYGDITETTEIVYKNGRVHHTNYY